MQTPMRRLMSGKVMAHLRPWIAIDVGTCWTRMATGGGAAMTEPTLQAVSRATGEVLAWGRAALERLARDGSSVRLERPVVGGVMADFSAYRFLLKEVLERAGMGRWIRPRVMMAVSPGLARVELAAVADACRQAGAADVRLVPSTLAAALGAGLPIGQVFGHMVVETGAGCCSAAVFSRHALVTARHERFGAGAIDHALEEHLRRESHIWVGGESLRAVKEAHASIRSQKEADETPPVRGMDLVTNLPRSVTIPKLVLRQIAWPSVRRLCHLVRETLADTPPELSGDILLSGIALTGGLARLEGLADELQTYTGCPVTVAPEPEQAVLRGLGLLAAEEEAGLNAPHAPAGL